MRRGGSTPLTRTISYINLELGGIFLKTEVEELEKNKVILKVEVPKENIKKAIGEAYKSIAKKVNIPGFRKGKVPPKIIDVNVGEEAVIDEMLRQLVPFSYAQAVEKTGIEPIDVPEIEVKEAKKDKVNFHAKVDVKPKVKLGDYKKLKIKRAEAKVTDKEVNQQIEMTRNNFASLEVAEDKTISEGDFALIDFDGLVDGKSFETGSAKDYLLEIGSNAIVLDFDKNLIGARKGETKEFEVNIPPKYDNPAIAGKTVKYKVFIKELKQKVLPELNDEFAEIVGGFKTLDDFKKDLKEKLEEAKKFKVEEEFRRNILDGVANGAEVDVPDIMISRTLAEMVDEFFLSLQTRGISPEDYFAATGSNLEELKKSLRERAEERTREELILEAIAKKENITAGEDEVDKEVKMIAERVSEEENKIKEVLREKGILTKIKEDILIRKALEYLVEQAEGTIKSKKGEDVKNAE